MSTDFKESEALMKPGSQASQILAFLRKIGKRGMTRGELEDAFPGMGRSSINSRLSQMQNKGLVATTSEDRLWRGKRLPVFVSTSYHPEADDTAPTAPTPVTKTPNEGWDKGIKEWEKQLSDAGRVYRANPTPENLTALIKAALN